MDTNRVGIEAIIDQGETVKLSDGRIFRVDPFDLPEVSTWTAANEIEVGTTDDLLFNYTLTNRDTEVWVRATKLG